MLYYVYITNFEEKKENMENITLDESEEFKFDQWKTELNKELQSFWKSMTK